jgi:hypothetical protein
VASTTSQRDLTTWLLVRQARRLAERRAGALLGPVRPDRRLNPGTTHGKVAQPPGHPTPRPRNAIVPTGITIDVSERNQSATHSREPMDQT